MPGKRAETRGYPRPRAKRPRLPTPRLSLQLQLRVHEVISSGLPPLPRTVEMQRAGIGLYNKLRSGVFLSNVAARGLKNHWTRRNVKITLIKRTALLVKSLLLLLLRSIAAWTRKIRNKINKRLPPSTATPPCPV